MIDPETQLAQPLVTALGWALIHFIWQGALIALLLAIVLRVLRRRSTNARYAVACAALFLMLGGPLATMALISPSTPDKTAGGRPLIIAPQPVSQPMPVGIEPTIDTTQNDIATVLSRPWLSIRSARVAPLLPWMILLWLLGVSFFSLRLAWAWLYAQRLRSHGTRALEEKWRQTLRRLCGQLRVTRPVQLLESALVQVPTAIGWLRPVILLPANALTGLTPQQLEAIIAHELAHIRRHDYLINLLQVLVETLLFYHPAVWWVSRRIRQEREHCCDDLAVAVCGDALAYARALLEMEQLRAAGPQLAMAANGGLLMNRIQRLVGAQPQHTNRFAGLFAGIIALSAVISVGAGAQILRQSFDRQIGSVRDQETKRVKISAETSGESNSADAGRADAGQPINSAQEDRVPEALLRDLQSASWEVRKAAVERLAQVSGDRAVELLIVALKDEHVQIREQAVIGLGIREDERLAEPLIAALTDREWQVREQAAIALGRMDDERAVEPLLRALTDSEWAVREQAARSLGTIGQEQAVEQLINALRDQNEQVREAAAKSLGVIGDRRALEPLNQALQDADEQVRKKAAEALGLLKQKDGESSTGALRKILRRQGGSAADQTLNRQAAADLSRMYDEQKEEALKVRIIIALARLNSEHARAKLSEITRREERFYLRERALDELARGMTADELSRLYDEQKEDRLKERVIIALARLSGERARAKLNEITRSEKRFYLRERAMDELAQVMSAEELVRLYDEQTEDSLKERVIIALARLNDERTRTKLDEITRSEKRFYLRERAMDELARRIIVGQAQPVVR